MSTTVIGLYDDEAAARKAVHALNDAGFEDERIHVEAHGADADWTSRSSNLLSTLTSMGVPRDEAEFYTEGVRRGGSLLILDVPDAQADRAASLMKVHEPVVREDREADWRRQGYTGHDTRARAHTADEAEAERARYRARRTDGAATERQADERQADERLTEAREELHVGKRTVQSGGVRLHKRVEERDVAESVRLREENVRVEHREGARATPADTDDLFEEKTIEVKERREEPVVEKKTKVTGEVVVTKEASERAETVRDTVRETHVDVERLGQSDDYRAQRATFAQHCAQTFDNGKDAFGTYEPAYRYGYAYGANDRYADVDFDRAQPELRRDYERRHGEGTFEGVKDAIRHAYRQARTSRRTTAARS